MSHLYTYFLNLFIVSYIYVFFKRIFQKCVFGVLDAKFMNKNAKKHFIFPNELTF